jgi:hypothetical protein
MDTLKTATATVDKAFKTALQNPYVMAFLKITLTLYAAQLAPRLPSSLQAAFNNTFVKIVAIMIILYLAQFDLQLAIVLSIVFVLGMNSLAGRKPFESFANYSSEYTADSGAELIEPKTVIYPGCHDLKMDDLIKAFDGDMNKLIRAVQYSYRELLATAQTKDAKERLMKIAFASGLPHNKAFIDENAPYIATLLVNQGFDLGGQCLPPQQ